MKILHIIITLSCLILFPSCMEKSKPGKRVLETFNAMYTNIDNVDWDKEGSYFVANFKINHKEVEAWFDKRGYWYMTQIEITYESLPDSVVNNLNNSKYRYWHIEDIEMVRYHNLRPRYCVEIEKEIHGQSHYLYLVYSQEGKLEKVINYDEQQPDESSDLDVIVSSNFGDKQLFA